MDSFATHMEILSEGAKTPNGKWGSVFFDRNGSFLPIYPSIWKKLFPVTKEYGAHLFGASNVKKLLFIQGKHYAISTFTEMGSLGTLEYMIENGIEGGTGYIALVSGDKMVDFPGDLYTERDPLGNRWFSPQWMESWLN